VHVSDGDTIVLAGIDLGEIHASTGGHKARLIGIDTPEVFGRAECYGRNASAFVRTALQGEPVSVDFDVDPIDRYGRALVYIWQADGTFFNGRLAREGFALQMTVPPNVRYAELFTRLVREAREADRGLWAGCAP
jgi:micrococcal nuclease